MADTKLKVAVYAPNYLNLSETFIQRQVEGVGGSCEILCITDREVNAGSFRGEKVVEIAPSIPNRILQKLHRDYLADFSYVPASLVCRHLEVLSGWGAQMVHAHFATGGLLLDCSTSRLRIPLVVTFHGWDASSLLRNRNAVDAISKMAERATFVCVSEAVKRKLLDAGVPDRHMTVHYIGVPLREFAAARELKLSRSPNSQPRFLHVGRMVEKKGVEFTLKAFRLVRQKLPGAELTLVGDGPLLEGMKRLTTDLELQSAVTFLGGQPNPVIRKLMAESDVFVLHSVTATDGDEEGLPIVLMEAMAIGCPVVSTEHSGIPELVLPEITGWLVQERNVEQYAEAMMAALKSGSGLSDAARSRVEQMFDADKQNEALIDLYRTAFATVDTRTA